MYKRWPHISSLSYEQSYKLATMVANKGSDASFDWLLMAIE
jgi:hypothetical protein